MKIGELSQKTGLAPSAIRFYEESGLLPPPSRGVNGYRHYAEETVERLRALLLGKRLGLSLETMRGLVTEQGECPKAKALEQMAVRLGEIDRLQASLETQRRDLLAARAMLAESLQSGVDTTGRP